MWTTKTYKGNIDYVVIRHPLRDIEGLIAGVKFRRGYCVVNKKSRYYTKLKQLPYLKNALEFDLPHLKTLPFIMRDRDVEVVFGKDVYYHYKSAVEKHIEKEQIKEEKEQTQEHLSSSVLCQHKTKEGKLCKLEALEYSPGQRCGLHLLQDPKLEEFDLSTDKKLTKDEKKKYKATVVKKLKKLKSEGKF